MTRPLSVPKVYARRLAQGHAVVMQKEEGGETRQDSLCQGAWLVNPGWACGSCSKNHSNPRKKGAECVKRLDRFAKLATSSYSSSLCHPSFFLG